MTLDDTTLDDTTSVLSIEDVTTKTGKMGAPSDAGVHLQWRDVTPLLTHWLRRGDKVILDRYVEANFGHQASKLPAGERPALIEALATRGCWLAEITRDHPRSPEIRRSPPLSTSGWPFPARTASPTSTCRRATRSLR